VTRRNGTEMQKHKEWVGNAESSK